MLLPPSEGKAAPAEGGAPVDPRALVHAEDLGVRREQLLELLDPSLRTAPAAPAHDVYTGVLFQQVDLARLAAGRDDVLVFSALWGVLRPGDRIPAYKLPVGERLPGAGGGLAAGWKPLLTQALPDAGLVVDLRSGGYAAMWRPKAAQVVEVKATDRHGKPVSHMVKATRGRVAAKLLAAPEPPATPQDVKRLVRFRGHRTRLHEPARDGAPWVLEVVEQPPAA